MVDEGGAMAGGQSAHVGFRTNARRVTGARIFACAFLALLMPALAGCGNNHEWNQKITVVVETPSGERSGSSVMHVEWKGGIPFIVGDAGGGGFRLRGEAPVVDLGGGRYMFALLRGMDRVAYEAIAGGRGGMADGGRAVKRANQPYTLPANLYPMLVTFDRISDPTSVRQVDPHDLAATFGPGYALKAMTLEITDEPVTVGIVDSIIEWINRLSDFRKDPSNPFTSVLPPEIGYIRRT